MVSALDRAVDCISECNQLPFASPATYDFTDPWRTV